jgi:hypothetical protein
LQPLAERKKSVLPSAAPRVEFSPRPGYTAVVDKKTFEEILKREHMGGTISKKAEASDSAKKLRLGSINSTEKLIISNV